MDFSEIEALAKQRESFPEQAAPEDWFCYQAMKNLYDLYRKKQMDLEHAVLKKQEIREQYQRLYTERAQQTAAWAQYQEFIRLGEGYAHQLKQALESGTEAPTVISLAVKLYGSLTGNEIWEKEFLQKVEEWKNGR